MLVVSASLLAGIAVVVPSVVTPTKASQARADVHHPYANGCSVPSWAFWLNKDNPSGLANVHSACDSHDLCYVFHAGGEYEAGRKACDDMFFRLMQQQINQQVPWWNVSGRLYAHNWAGIYYQSVRAGGFGPFYDNWKPSRANVQVYR